MVDILMATYNGEKYLKQQIDSILEQTYEDWKIIIHDDGSSDNTLDIVKEYVMKYPEKILWIDDKISTGGAKNNFFHLFQHADAPYIMLSDQDDVWQKDKIKNAVAEIKSAEKKYGQDIPLLGHSDLKVVDEKLNIMNISFFDMQRLNFKKSGLAAMLVQNNITGCTTIFNQCLKNMCKEMPEEAIMHDWWLGLVANAFGKVFFMDNNDIQYRQHGNNTEGAKNLKSPTYLLKKFFKKKEMKDSLLFTYKQAVGFKRVFDKQLDDKNREILDAYISLENLGKLKKLKLMKKYGFIKTGLVRMIGQIMYI